jgi:hypothetical protein
LPAVFVAATHPAPTGSVAGLAGHVVTPVMSLPAKKSWMVAETTIGFVPVLTMPQVILLPSWAWESEV